MVWVRTTNSETGSTLLSVILIVPYAAAAVGWYTAALGAAELWNLGGVAGLHIDGAPFFIHEAVPDRRTEPSQTDVGLTTTRIDFAQNSSASAWCYRCHEAIESGQEWSWA